jgi:hypothetical protein
MEKNHIRRCPSKLFALILFSFVILVGILFVLPGDDVSAKTSGWLDESPLKASNQLSPQECLSCHQLPDMFLPLANGEELSLTIDPKAFANSVHGREGKVCTDCHTQITAYPHPEFSIEDRREVSIQLTQVCIDCHPQSSELYAKGRHAQEFVKGNHETALCVDCHTSHQIKDIRGSKGEIAKTCQTCHSTIYDIYQDSVHGVALIDDQNFDVPTCSDCHENHDNTGPGDAGFILFSPKICEDCHADVDLMDKYDIRSNVFETYVADFHGTTVTIFENISPDQETNKPVCIDCHGVHDIRSADDENSSVMKENLLSTCHRCHPDATSDFSDSWMGHYQPDINHNPLVYLVNLFYYVIIPGTMGGIILFIGTDIWRKVKNKREGDDGGES